MERSVAFFSDVLTFEKVSDVEVAGERVRAAARPLRYADANRPHAARRRADRTHRVPDTRAAGRFPWTHAATIAGSSTSPSSCRDMDAAYARLRQNKVEHASPGPQRLPDWNPNAGGIKAFYFKDPDGHRARDPAGSRRERAIRSGTRRIGSSSLASTTPRSS